MRWSRFAIVTSLAATLGLAAGLSGCMTVNDQAEFESEAGILVCEWNTVCAPTLTSSSSFTDPYFPYPADDTCEMVFAEERQSCGTCRYNPTAAHKCLKKLEEVVSTCDSSEVDFGACRKVYSECESESVEAMCDIDDPNCSVVDEPGPGHALLGLALALIGLGIRRRAA